MAIKFYFFKDKKFKLQEKKNLLFIFNVITDKILENIHSPYLFYLLEIIVKYFINGTQFLVLC